MSETDETASFAYNAGLAETGETVMGAEIVEIDQLGKIAEIDDFAENAEFSETTELAELATKNQFCK